MKKVFLLSIRFYQRFLSLDTGLLHYIVPVRICRFTPSCSEYTYQAIARYGIIKGLILGVKRILHCHPWNKGGFDPLPSNF